MIDLVRDFDARARARRRARAQTNKQNTHTTAMKRASGKSKTSGKRGTVQGKSRTYSKGTRSGRNTEIVWGKGCKFKLNRKYVVKATGRFQMKVLLELDMRK